MGDGVDAGSGPGLDLLRGRADGQAVLERLGVSTCRGAEGTPVALDADGELVAQGIAAIPEAGQRVATELGLAGRHMGLGPGQFERALALPQLLEQGALARIIEAGGIAAPRSTFDYPMHKPAPYTQ